MNCKIELRNLIECYGWEEFEEAYADLLEESGGKAEEEIK